MSEARCTVCYSKWPELPGSARLSDEVLARLRFVGDRVWQDSNVKKGPTHDLIAWAEGVQTQAALLRDVLSGTAMPVDYDDDFNQFIFVPTVDALGVLNLEGFKVEFNQLIAAQQKAAAQPKNESGSKAASKQREPKVDGKGKANPKKVSSRSAKAPAKPKATKR